MGLTFRAMTWIAVYLAVTVAPLVFALVGASQPGRGFLHDFAAALGFVGLAMIGLQFALVARFRVVAAPFGQDALLQFHRQIGWVGLGFVVAHLLLLIAADRGTLALLNVLDAPWRARFGVLGLLSLLAVVVSSAWRERLRLRYEVWHVLHGVLGVLAVLGGLTHVLLVDYYVDSLPKQVLWTLMSAAFLALIVWVRVLKPLRQRRRPWRLERVERERGDTTTLTLRPPGGGFRFQPGQFAWFAIDRSPFSPTQHPFSLASSAEVEDRVAISVKALGDFTATVQELEPGATVYVDGPHGVFSIDRHEGPGYCFVAGGVGITALIAMLRTMADRGDVRPVVLLYATEDRDGATFLEELEELRGRLSLELVHVVADPPEGWEGETGHVTADVLARHLPEGYRRLRFLVCGPPPMLDAVEDALLELDVPPERIHAERFGFV